MPEIATPAANRARATNEGGSLPGIDGRSSWARRIRDLTALHAIELGGSDRLTPVQRALVRRAAILEVQLERMEQRFALDTSSDDPLGVYATGVYAHGATELRELLGALGIGRPSVATKERTS